MPPKPGAMPVDELGAGVQLSEAISYLSRRQRILDHDQQKSGSSCSSTPRYM